MKKTKIMVSLENFPKWHYCKLCLGGQGQKTHFVRLDLVLLENVLKIAVKSQNFGIFNLLKPKRL
jgi:hypothetical protein